jgi:PAS domain S-box-containing protein
MSILSRLVDISATESESIRRRKLLDALLALLAITSILQECVILAILAFDLPIHPPLAEARFRVQAHVGTAVAVLLCALVFAINRYWSGMFARLLFVLLLAASVFGNTPNNWTLAAMTFALMIPIVIASFLLGPRASFVAAGLSSLATSVVGVLLNIGVYVTPIFNFFSIAMLAWFTARTLEHALRDLRVLNLELDQRVRDRTQELAESLSKTEAILDSTADGVIVFSNDGVAIVANPAIGHLLGESVEEIVGRDIEALMGEAVDATGREMIASAMADREQLQTGLKLQWGKKTLSVSLAPVRDVADRAIGTVAVFRDFTREAEIDHMKSTFVSIASHELRTPLNGILGYTSMLQEDVYGPLPDKQRVVVERIAANAGHMLGLASNLLDRARIEAGTLTLNVADLSLPDLVDDVQALVGTTAKAKGLELTSHIADDVPAVLVGDEQRLHQILVNLVGNAVKFTEEGKVSLHVYLLDAAHWALEVSDTGCGIPQEAQSYIFEPFRQADESTSREYGGAGLGLSIVKQLIELMGGEIRLESEVGQGSTFTIILPLALSADECLMPGAGSGG